MKCIIVAGLLAMLPLSAAGEVICSIAACIDGSSGEANPTDCSNFRPMSCIELAEEKSTEVLGGCSTLRLRILALPITAATAGP
jgi:hypothetical protein